MLTNWTKGAAGVVVVLLGFGFAPQAVAQNRIEIQLNRMHEADEGCQITTVFTNRSGNRLDQLAIEVAVFNQEGQVDRLVLLSPRPLPPGKIAVRRFGLDDLPCDSISRFLFNHVATCEGDGLDPETCSQFIAVSSRTEVPFISTVSDQEAGTDANRAEAEEGRNAHDDGVEATPRGR